MKAVYNYNVQYRRNFDMKIDVIGLADNATQEHDWY